MKDKIQLFEDRKVRSVWDDEKEEWFFSIVDVCCVLAQTNTPRRYWSDLKRKLKKEGAEQVYDKIVQLKMLSSDGKSRQTDAANIEQLLRIIQSIPSPRAEPFKQWLAQLGAESRVEQKCHRPNRGKKENRKQVNSFLGTITPKFCTIRKGIL